MKKPIKEEALLSWTALNQALMSSEDEYECYRLIRVERKGRRRRQFILRIYSRLNKLRADRERRELTA